MVDDLRVLVGTETADDAAVYQLNEAQALVITLDYFTPVVDTPYEFGQVAAANSLSDIYAMGARPLVALNVVGFPAKSPELGYDVLREILRGGSDKACEAGIFVVGGHTIDDDEPKYGLGVVGEVRPDRVVRNIGAQVGDWLILTKPIGTGIIATAIKNQVASEAQISLAFQAMAHLNRSASDAMTQVGAHAATDVTGFGLLGHLHEMTASSQVGARVVLSRVPILEGVWELAREDYVPGGSYANMEFLGDAVAWDEPLSEVERVVLCDAQTSGGLLMAVSPGKAPMMLDALEQSDVLVAAEIGEIIEDPSGRIHVTC